MGLQVVGVRRTPGLRREELATLAGISNDYYLRLEQGRDRNPSRHDVATLAGGLAHLFHPLVGPMDLHRHKFPIGGTDGLLLATYNPAAGSVSAAAMARLLQTITASGETQAGASTAN